MNIFIVEDYGIACEHLQIMLSDIPGVAVIGHAPDEPGVIERIQALLPDVVILNISRQTEPVIGVLESVKKCHAEIKVMVLANDTDKCHVDRCMRAGADYFFDKVFFDKSFQFMRVRAALWQLVHTSVLNDRFILNDKFVALQ